MLYLLELFAGLEPLFARAKRFSECWSVFFLSLNLGRPLVRSQSCIILFYNGRFLKSMLRSTRGEQTEYSLRVWSVVHRDKANDWNYLPTCAAPLFKRVRGDTGYLALFVSFCSKITPDCVSEHPKSQRQSPGVVLLDCLATPSPRTFGTLQLFSRRSLSFPQDWSCPSLLEKLGVRIMCRQRTRCAAIKFDKLTIKWILAPEQRSVSQILQESVCNKFNVLGH